MGSKAVMAVWLLEGSELAWPPQYEGRWGLGL